MHQYLTIAFGALLVTGCTPDIPDWFLIQREKESGEVEDFPFTRPMGPDLTEDVQVELSPSSDVMFIERFVSNPERVIQHSFTNFDIRVTGSVKHPRVRYEAFDGSESGNADCTLLYPDLDVEGNVYECEDLLYPRTVWTVALLWDS